MSDNMSFGQFTDAVADRLRQGQAAKPNTTDRQRLLEYAGELIHGDRNESYDEPAANFARIAALWSAYLGVELKPHDVAVLNVLQKVARLMHTPGHYDSWTDIAGYAACGYEAWLSGGEGGSCG